MNYALYVHQNAQDELQKIKYYIRDILQNNKAAEDFVVAVEKKYARIIREPHLYPTKVIGNITYRKAFVKNYIIIFRIDEPEKAVKVITVAYCGSDYPRRIIELEQ